MALPTSTLVMAVLTCIPFGLAIRDTVSGTTGAHRDRDAAFGDDEDSDDSAYSAEYAAAEARREAEEAEAERANEVKQAATRAARRSLFGAEVATLGEGFRGITLGMPEENLRSEVITPLEDATHVDIVPLTNLTLDGLLIQGERGADDEDKAALCSQLGEDLRLAWGKGITEDYESRYWINPTTGTRASLHPGEDDCTLHVERFVTVKDWIHKTQSSSVPVWLVGQPVAKLRAYLTGRATIEDAETVVQWLGLGVGAGAGETRFEAHLAKGKVVAITAKASALNATFDEVLEQLTALYGEASEDDEGVSWKSRPALRLDTYNATGVAVTVGKIPED